MSRVIRQCSTSCTVAWWLLNLSIATHVASAADMSSAQFLVGINLNGPPVTIDGRAWTGTVDDAEMSRFEDTNVPLVPATTPERTQMLRSSLWHPSGANRVVIRDLPEGPVTVFLWVWEDNDAQVYSVFVQGVTVADQISSGSAGSWQRLGPFHTEAKRGEVELTSSGGHANWSGLEVWRGHVDRHPSRPVSAMAGALPVRSLKSDRVASPATPAQQQFEQQIAPILAQHCLECHGPLVAEGDVDLSSAESARSVLGDGQLDSSRLWEQVSSGAMPKDRPAINVEELSALKEWLSGGGAWGRGAIDPFSISSPRRAGYDWWSFQPIRTVAAPAVRDASWCRGTIDTWVLSRLETEGWQPSPSADPATLVRRVTFDLTGLPPTFEDVQAFERDPSDAAYAALVDRLLDSPAFGEHWARHWLDVIRFGESQGFERNRIRENAWRFRDWVIDAFNDDLPYDEFVRRQVAGDVLYPDDLSALIATGYLVIGTWDQVGHHEGSATMRRVAYQEHLEDLVGGLGQSFLGLTLQCSRCHDHKFDPISTQEYYQIAAALGGVHQQEKERSGIALAATDRQPGFEGVAHVIVPQQPPVFEVLKRGSIHQPAGAVSPAGLASVSSVDPDWGLDPMSPEGQRRIELAEWLTAEANPLTLRVFVNRMWHYLFGDGLVDTPSDFGFQGGKPSHPELLDWLAHDFVQNGWKMKRLIRQMVLSSTYRQRSDQVQSNAVAVDHSARLRWRAPFRRLTGEQLRDAMLLLSGTLNPQRGGPSYRDVHVKLGQNHEFTDPTNEFTPDTSRRTIYRLWARSGAQPMLASFDCPDPSVASPRRSQTITPLQALSLLNGPFSVWCSEHMATSLESAAPGDVVNQVELGYERVLLRRPSDDERTEAVRFIADGGLPAWCQVLLNSNEFLFLK
jgi:cytochrome c553